MLLIKSTQIAVEFFNTWILFYLYNFLAKVLEKTEIIPSPKNKAYSNLSIVIF